MLQLIDARGVALDTQNGDVYVATDTGLSGLGAINWDKIGSVFKQGWETLGPAIAQRIAGKPAIPAPALNPASITTQGPGFFGSIDPIYLLLAAGVGAFLLFKKS